MFRILYIHTFCFLGCEMRIFLNTVKDAYIYSLESIMYCTRCHFLVIRFAKNRFRKNIPFNKYSLKYQ